MITSYLDPVFGDQVGSGGASPSQSAANALSLYLVPTSQTLQGMLVRFAQAGLSFCGTLPCGNAQHYVNNCTLYNCNLGIYAVQSQVNISNTTGCQLSTPSSAFQCPSIGTITTVTAPSITTSPANQCQFVYTNFSSVTFNGASSSHCVHTWALQWDGSVLGTSVGSSSYTTVNASRFYPQGAPPRLRRIQGLAFRY